MKNGNMANARGIVVVGDTLKHNMKRRPVVVLAVVPAVLAALTYVLAMCAPVSVRRGVVFKMLAVCFGLLGACAFLGLYLCIAVG